MGLAATPPPGPPPLPPSAGQPRHGSAPFPGRGDLLRPLAALVLGMCALLLVAVWEAAWMADAPWVDAGILSAESPDFEGGREVLLRPLPGGSHGAEGDGGIIESMEFFFPGSDADSIAADFFAPERVMVLPMHPGELEPLLASGRMPEAGRREVLAGDLARDGSFELDGRTFAVVGHIDPRAGAFLYHYVLPWDDGLVARHFEGEAVEEEIERGVFHTDLDLILTQWRADRDAAPEATDDEEHPSPSILTGRMSRSRPGVQWAVLSIMMGMAAAGALFHIRLFQRLAWYKDQLVQPVFIETVRRPKLFVGMHVGLYAVFFGAMAAGLSDPLLNYRLTAFVSHAFLEGDLKYIGDAYASGNVLSATVATFVNNFIYQTLLLTFLISIVPLALGVAKTALSFGLAGFVMAPVWSGTASGYAYHSLTMVIELEAYILACFCVAVWPLRMFQAIRTTDEKPLIVGLRVFFGGILLTGIMLFIGAFYEAATLIGFNR